jgi:tetratricopeptide (TPR) repeat protein
MPVAESEHSEQPPSLPQAASPSRSNRTLIAFIGAVLVIVFLLYWVGMGSWRRASADVARFHWREAEHALAERDYRLAKSHLEQSLEAAPLNGQAHFAMAQTCRRLDDPAAWSDYLHKAGVLGWPLEQIQLELRLKEAQTGNTWIVEEGLVDELNAKTPEQAIILEALVKGYLENDRPKDAHRLSEEWVRDHPEDWQARLYRGRASQLGVFFQQAIIDYQSVLQAKPNQPQARLWLAETLVSDRQYAPAMEHYQAFLRDHPDAPETSLALLGLANCRYSLGEVDAARAILNELLAKRPDYTPALLLRAQLEHAESAEKALSWLLKAEATAPNDPQVLNVLVLALRELQRNDEAQKYDQRLKDQKSKTDELIKLRQQLLEDAENLELRFQMASLHLQLGDDDEAAHWFQTILWIDPTHRPTFRALADYWQKKGNSTRANHYRYLAEGKTPPDASR